MLKKLTPKRNRKGFTLVELIVVIAILGILAAIAVPRLSGTRDKAAIKADIATAATIAKAGQLYALENEIADGGAITITLNELQDKGYLDNKPVPQYKKGGTKFVLTHTTGAFEVTYGTNEVVGKKLYPTVDATLTN